jgi:PAS domain S-box-containing protein
MNSTPELTRAANGRTQAPIQEAEALAELTQSSPAANAAAIAGRDVQALWLEDSHSEIHPAQSHLPAAILDALPANIALLNAAGVIVTVNGAWRRFAEENQFATPNHGVGRNYLDLCAQTQGAEASEAHLVATGIRAVLQGKQKSFALEYACHSPTEERWFAMTVTPLTAEQVDGVVVMHRNVTERKRTELRLLEVLVEGQRFRAALDQVSACIYMKDRESRYLYANRPTLELFGCSATELVGRPDADFFPPETVRRLREVDGRVLQGEATNEEIEAVHGTGDHRVYLEVKTPLYDESDPPRIIGLLGVSTDMTERRRSEREEERKQQRYLQQRNALINFAEATPVTAQLDDTLRRITETSAATLGVARVSVWRYNEDHSAIRCVDLFEAASGRHSSGLELAAADYPAYFRALAARSVVVAADAQQHESTREFAEHYLRPLGISAMLDAPLHLGGQVAGVLCHEHIGPVRSWTTDEETFALAAANLVSNALEVAERKRAQAEREALHQQLVMASRQSGMAEIATNVLHNVGNVLNSVNVSTSLIADTLKSSKLRRLGQLAELLRAHAGDMAEFLARDPKGKQVPTYLRNFPIICSRSTRACWANWKRCNAAWTTSRRSWPRNKATPGLVA